MGFLTSPIAAEAQNRADRSYAIGLQLGVEQANRNLAAANAIKQSQAQQQAELQRQLMVKQAMSDDRMAELKQKAEATKELKAYDFTRYTAAEGLKGLERGAGNLTRLFQKVYQNPDQFGDDSLQSVSEYANNINNVLADASTAVAGLQPGQAFDPSPYTSKLGSLKPPQISLRPEYAARQSALTDESKSRTYKNYLGQSGKGQQTTTPVEDWQDALANYQVSDAQLAARANDIDPAQKQMAIANGHDPFAPERKALETSNVQANQWGRGVRSWLYGSNGDPDLRTLTDALEKEGIEPWNPLTVDKVGKRLFQLSQKPGAKKEDVDALNNAAHVMTGRPLRAWGAPPVQMGTSAPATYAPSFGAPLNSDGQSNNNLFGQ